MKVSLLFLLIVCSHLGAAQKFWTGLNSNNWSDVNNWNPIGTIPVDGEDVVFPAGAPDCKLDVDPAILNSLSMNVGYAGDIDLDGRTITISGTAANNFLSGTISGTGLISITSSNAALFDGAVLGPNVTLTATLTTATGIFTGGPGTTFGGPVNITAVSILLNGSTYNSAATFNKSGIPAVLSLGTGGNTFNGPTTIINSMNHIFRVGNVAPNTDTFNGLLTLNLNGTNSGNYIQLSFAVGTHTNFNNHVRIRSNNNATMSQSCGVGCIVNATLSIGGSINATGGTATLAPGFTLDEIDPLVAANNFQKGDLILRNFTQSGNTPQTLAIRNPVASPSANNLRVFILNSNFNGTVNYSFSNSYVNFSTFNNVTTFNKTTGGGGDDTFPPPHAVNTWRGGNHFKTTVNFNHYNTSTWVMGSVNGDIFEGDVNLYSDLANTPTLGSFFRLAEGATSVFYGNINITQKVGLANEIKVEFGRGGGTAEFRGNVLQSINSPEGVDDLAIKFGNLHINNPDGLDLNFPATVLGNALFESGVILTSLTDSLTFRAGSSVTGASDASFVDGPVIKRGNTAFVFPLGSTNSYHPLAIDGLSDASSSFLAHYVKANHGLGEDSDDALIETISDCEHWNLERLAGTDNPLVTLYWNDASFCHTDYIVNPSALQVMRWSGATWNNLGEGGIIDLPSPDGTEGNIVAGQTLPDAAAHILTFGSLDAANILPIELTSFQVVARGMDALITWQTATEINNDYFTIERLQENHFVAIGKVKGAGTTTSPVSYSWTDTRPSSGRSYYRLKQTDFDGQETYSEVISFQQPAESTPYPNPVVNTLFLDGVSFSEDSKIVLRDISGRTLYSSGAVQSIDFSSLPQGIYHLGIAANGSVKWYPIRKE